MSISCDQEKIVGNANILLKFIIEHSPCGKTQERKALDYLYKRALEATGISHQGCSLVQEKESETGD